MTGNVGASGCERVARGGRICEGIFALVPPACLESLRAYFREFAVARLWITKKENGCHELITFPSCGASKYLSLMSEFAGGTASSGQVCCATLSEGKLYTWGKPDGAFDSDRLRPKTFLWGATTVTDLMAFDTAISTKALTENRLVCVCGVLRSWGKKHLGCRFSGQTTTQNRTGGRQVVYMPFRRRIAARRHIQHFYLSNTFPLHSTTPAII